MRAWLGWPRRRGLTLRRGTRGTCGCGNYSRGWRRRGCSGPKRGGARLARKYAAKAPTIPRFERGLEIAWKKGDGRVSFAVRRLLCSLSILAGAFAARGDEPMATVLADFEDSTVAAAISEATNTPAGDC